MNPRKHPKMFHLTKLKARIEPHEYLKNMIITVWAPHSSKITVSRASISTPSTAKSVVEKRKQYESLSYTQVNERKGGGVTMDFMVDSDQKLVVGNWYVYKITALPSDSSKYMKQTIYCEVRCANEEVPGCHGSIIQIHPFKNSVLLKWKRTDKLLNCKISQRDKNGKAVVADKIINIGVNTYDENAYPNVALPDLNTYSVYELSNIKPETEYIYLYGVNVWGTSHSYNIVQIDHTQKGIPNLTASMITTQQIPHEKAFMISWNDTVQYFNSYLNGVYFAPRRWGYISLEDYKYGDTINYNLQLESFWGKKSAVVPISLNLKDVALPQPKVTSCSFFLNTKDELEMTVTWEPVLTATKYVVAVVDLTINKVVQQYIDNYSNIYQRIVERNHKYEVRISSARESSWNRTNMTIITPVAVVGGRYAREPERVYALCVAGATHTSGSFGALHFKKAMEANYIESRYMVNPERDTFINDLKYLIRRYDTLILYLAGHGSVNDIEVFSDPKKSIYENTKLSYKDLADILDEPNFRGQKILFIDSCYSAASISGYSTESSWTNSKDYAEKPEYKAAAGVIENFRTRSKTRSREFTNNSGIKPGYHVLCSSGSALTSSGTIGECTNFTKHLVAALGWDSSKGQAIKNPDSARIDGDRNTITMEEIYDYTYYKLAKENIDNNLSVNKNIPVLAPPNDHTVVI